MAKRFGMFLVGVGIALSSLFSITTSVSAQDVWAYKSGTCDGYVMTETIKPSNLASNSACQYEVTTKFVSPNGKYEKYIWEFGYDEGAWWYSMRGANVSKRRSNSSTRVSSSNAAAAILNVIAEYSDYKPCDW